MDCLRQMCFVSMFLSAIAMPFVIGKVWTGYMTTPSLDLILDLICSWGVPHWINRG